MEKTILSVAETTFKGSDGNDRTMYKLYLADDKGQVGCVYSAYQHSVGEVVSLGLAVNKDGKFVARVIESRN